MAKKKIHKKTQINEDIGYAGYVSVRLQKGRKIIKTLSVKNIGTNNLFRGIALALIGAPQSMLKSYLPGFISIGYDSEKGRIQPTDTSMPGDDYIPRNRPQLSSRNIQAYTDNTSNAQIGYIAPFSAVIPSTAIPVSTEPGHEQESVPINEIGIFSTSSGNSLLACVPIYEEGEAGTTNPIIVPNGFNLVVEWNLVIQNKEI